MTVDEIESAIWTAVQRFAERDHYLAQMNVCERSMTHKIAGYLESSFPDWDVDCEYNRNGHGPKIVDLPGYTLGRWKGRKTYPGIVIHRRGDNKRNLLILEAKKRLRADFTTTDDLDRQKIEAYVRDLHYFAGCMLTICVRERLPRFRLTLYHQGRWRTSRTGNS